MSKRLSYTLKTSKSSEYGPQAAEQIFSAVPYTPAPFLGLLPFFHPEPISFEIVVINQVTSFQVNIPSEHDHYLRSQIIAAYPGVTIEESSPENHRLSPLYQNPLLVRNFTLTNGNYYPLKTYADFSETDPLSAVLGTLSKLLPGQSALIQLLVASTGDGWKKSGFNLAAGHTDSEGKHTPNPDRDLIETKLNQICHRFALTIATSAPEISQAHSIMNNIYGSFAAFTNAKSNSLATHKPWLRQKDFINSLPYRDFSGTKKQYLSIQELSSIWHLPYEKFKDIKNIAWGKTLLGEPPENLPTHESLTDEEKIGVNIFAKTEYKNTVKTFGIRDEDRRRHMYIIGKSGTGKSTLLANMIINDIRNDKGVAVIDPHGDLVEQVLDYIPSHRINDVVYLNPADPEFSVRLNLLEASDHQFKELIASGIIAIFKKLYGHSWGPRLEYILRNTLLTLVEKDQATLEDIVKLLTNPKYLDRTIEKLEDPVLKNFWVNEWGQMQDRQKVEAISPILNKIGQFVTSPMIRHVISSPTSSFSIEEVMNGGKILLCNLSQGKLGEDNAAMMGAMLITKIQLAAMNRVYIAEEQRRDFILFVDEFQNFATTSFIKILSEARKYRLSLILANQYVEQIDPDVRAAIFGNSGTLITFLVGAADAALLSQEFGQQYAPEDLVSISNHQIVLKLMVENTQSQPFPAWTLPLAENKNDNREKVIKVSNERYAKKKISYGKKDPIKEAVVKSQEMEQKQSKNKPVDQNSQQYVEVDNDQPAVPNKYEREPQPGQVKPATDQQPVPLDHQLQSGHQPVEKSKSLEKSPPKPLANAPQRGRE